MVLYEHKKIPKISNKLLFEIKPSILINYSSIVTSRCVFRLFFATGQILSFDHGHTTKMFARKWIIVWYKPYYVEFWQKNSRSCQCRWKGMFFHRSQFALNRPTKPFFRKLQLFTSIAINVSLTKRIGNSARKFRTKFREPFKKFKLKLQS